MNILLIYPEFPDTFWSFKHALKFVRKRAALPPLGLLTVAAMMPEDWNKRLVDLNVRPLRNEDLAWADYAFVSAMTIQKASALTVIQRCHAAGVKIVAGGPLFAYEAIDFPEIDHLVLGEAELALPPLLADLAGGRVKPVYRAKQFADVKTTPIPLWHLADLKRYATVGVQLTRGCPFACEFCNVTSLFGRTWRCKGVEQLLAELTALRQAGWRGPVFFVDDNLIGNPKFLRDQFLPALIQWQGTNQPFSFNTQVSINLADDEQLLRLMAKAGFDTVFIGIETPDELGLAECHKTQNRRRDMIADVRRIQQAGMEVQGGFIVGFDCDTPSIFQRQIDFIQNSGIVTAMVGMLQAPPGTKLYERLFQAGRLRGHSSGDNADGSTNIIPNMGIEALHEGYKRILRHIYAPKPYYQRVRTLLRHYKRPTIATPTDRYALLAIFTSLYRLGILGRERGQYWKLMLWTLLRRPRMMPAAIRLAITGYHYRKVCQLHIE